MKFQYEKGAGWGKLKIGGKTFDARVFLGYAGLLFWLTMLFITGGAQTPDAIGRIAGFLILLLAITIPVRSIALKSLYSLFFYGAFSMGIATLLCKLAQVAIPGGATSYMLVPIIETFLFLAPGLIFLWVRRRFSLWELGASDIMLIFAFAGAGFEIVELAAIANKAGGSLGGSPLFLIPTAYEAGDRIRGLHFQNGQAVWATIAGAAIAIASFYRSKPSAIGLAALGIFWAWFDHFGVNIQAQNAGGFANSLANLLTGEGRFTTYICFLAIVGCVAFDYHLIYRNLPVNLRLTVSKYAKTLSREWLYYIHANRRLAFSFFRTTKAQGESRNQSARMFAIGYERILRYGTKPVATVSEIPSSAEEST